MKRLFPFILICCFYLGVSLLFNFQIWKQVFIQEPAGAIFISGESPIYEYVAERVYQNLLAKKNPFASIPDVLYPLGWNFALDDISPLNGIYFLLLRPFLSIHQSLMFIVVAGIFAANFTMYLLLRLLKIEKRTAFLFGLVYGFTPFLSLRVGGHPSYTAFYVFPLLALLFLFLTQKKNPLFKVGISILLGISLVITVLTNLYFAVMVAVMLFLLVLFYSLTNRTVLFQVVKTELIYLIFTLLTAIILLIPWFVRVYRLILFQQYSQPPSLVDTVAFSSDLFGIFIPSYLNPFYSLFVAFVVKKIPAFGAIFENFIYPGVLILVPLCLMLIFHKQLKKHITSLLPLLLTSFIFWIFTLGPYMHILGRKLSIPLPYIFLSFIPYLQMARAPGRFIVPFIFLGSIVSAVLIDSLLKKKKAQTKNYIFFFLLLIFFIDQSYSAPPFGIKTIPVKIYDYISARNSGPILEIPFAIRDGLDYLGDIHAVWSFRSQLMHKQPIFGAYFGRINETTFSYYRNDALLGTLGQLIDRGSTNTGEIVKNMNINRMNDSADFLGIEHSILDTNASYATPVKSILEKIGFSQVFIDNGYALFQRKPEKKEFTRIQFGSETDNLFLEQGWGEREESGRWVIGNVAQVIFRLKESHPLKLKFSAKTLQTPQEMTVYANKKSIGTISMGTNLRTYTFFANEELRDGINIITLRFSKTFFMNNFGVRVRDRRPLAAFFTNITIEDAIPTAFSQGNASEFTKIDFSNPSHEQFLLQGWSDPEEGARWTEGKSAKALFYVNRARPMKLHLRAESIYKPQKVRVYLNNLFSGEVTVATDVSADYFVDVSNSLKSGVNILTLKFSHTQQLEKIGKDPNDTRDLSLFIKYLALEE